MVLPAHGTPIEGKGREESSFLKKRSKRLLFLRQLRLAGHGRELGSGGEMKVLCFFLSRKKCLLPSTFV
jgi:hypothetical protein